jgi:enoyl-CoA hydratase/3-hydroxyacyl-CoA dehydrogenase
MGSGIAQKMAQEGLRVILADVSDEAAQRGLAIITNLLKQGVEKGVFTDEKVSETLGNLKVTSNMEDMANCDLIVEAIFEDIEAKGQLFKKLDGICGEKTIFATNTSSFYVQKLAEYTKRPDRVIGMHYFYHPAKNRLLEVIPHEGTSDQTRDMALLIGKLHGKTTILVKDAPGFAVNRFFVPFLTHSIRLLEEGAANIKTIEEGAKRAFSIGMGPFELMNVTGIPIALHSSTTFGQELGDFYTPPELLGTKVKEKTPWDIVGDIEEDKIQYVMDYLYGVTLGVAAALADEGVTSIEDADRGAKIGLRWRYGPFELINKVGVAKTYDLVKKVSEKYPSFKTPGLLERQAKAGNPFEFRYVDLEVKGGIATITINRPEAMNALIPALVDQLENKFGEAEADANVKAIVIQGAGKAFVAGADIKFFVGNIKAGTIEKSVAFTEQGHKLFRRFETSPKLTIALVDGLSLGGGSELALACQAIVATPQGSFGFPETGIGIYPGLGGMIRTRLHAGKEMAKYYVFTGKTIRAADAYDLGIVTKLVDPEDIDAAINEIVSAGKFDKYRPRQIPERFKEQIEACSDENIQKALGGEAPSGVSAAFAKKFLEILAIKAPLALKTSNELIDAQSKTSIDEAIKLELGRLVEIFATEDALIGLQSVGKAPEFKGR